MNEQLSAFLDNEATRDESDSVVNALLRDEGLRDSWTRQHWIRTTLRAHSAEAPVAVDTEFANRVMAAVAQDVPSDSPSDSNSVAPSSARVVPMMRTGRTRRWRGVAGFAAAASVAGVVLLTGNPFVRSGGTSEQRIASNAAGSGQATTPAREASARDRARDERQGFGSGGWNDRLADFSSVSAEPARVSTVSAGGRRTEAQRGSTFDERSADHWSVSDPAVRDELNGYLADHNGMARDYGMSGTTPGLVRVATYGSGSAQ